MVLRYTGGISATIMMSMVRIMRANIDDGDNKVPIPDINNGTDANDTRAPDDTYWY